MKVCKFSKSRFLVFLKFSTLLVTLASIGTQVAFGDELTFEKDIRPIFRANCFDCHGATDEKESNLDLRQVRLMLMGGDSGAALVAGKADSSLLLERIVSGEMPPGDHPVPADQIAKIRKWINGGAKTARPEPKSIPRGLGITPEERSYWAFQPITRPKVPTVQSVDRVRTPIDAFLLASMESKGLAFAKDTDKRKLIRRAYLGLIGLPPSPEKVDDFLSDKSNDAWEKVVEELLASKHYGERWGRHWLDVAGYADSEGAGNRDDLRPWAFKYRDWVIQAFNRDMPFDQFITWQLAGDELVRLPHKNFSAEEIEKLTATGFLRMAMDGTLRANNEENRNAVVRDTIEIVTSSLLGLSVKCAQCHDHRYDPISHEDYYRLRAIFEPVLDSKNWRTPNARLVSLYTDADHAKAKEIEKLALAKQAEKNKKLVEYMKLALENVLSGIDEKLRDPLRKAYMTPSNKRTEEQKSLLKKYPSVGSFSPGVLYQYNQKHADELKAMDAEIAKIRATKPAHEFLRSVAEAKSKKVPVTKLFHRGDYRQPKYEVEPGGLTVCAPEESPFRVKTNSSEVPTTGRRLAYAKWLTSGRHPLVARVLVNRIWLHHFGKTFVSTPDEFGKLGSLPKHQELLDWLADEFMAKGWSLKQLHRIILKSTVYQQASTRNQKFNKIDQDNDLYWHFPVQRLDAEAIRDTVLSISGRLDVTTQFGKPIAVKEDDTGQVIVSGDKQRRSIYLQVRRSKPLSLLESFDAPVMKVNCPVRPKSTAATQSLMLMNSKFMVDAAEAFARRINAESNTVPDMLIHDPDIDEVVKKFLPADPWSYGHGLIRGKDENARTRFTPYTFFKEGTWKGGGILPDPKLGWSLLHANGGHPDLDRASIRRWTSPINGKIRINGVVSHGSEKGNGVSLFIISSRRGKLLEKVAVNSTQQYALEFKVFKGEAIDTLVDSREDCGYDGYSNSFRIEHLDAEKKTTWMSKRDFKGPDPNRYLKSPVSKQIYYAWQLAYGRSPTLEEIKFTIRYLTLQFEALQAKGEKQPVRVAMNHLCHMLLSSNEFLYVD